MRAATSGDRYIEAAEELNGIVGNICLNNYQRIMNDLGLVPTHHQINLWAARRDVVHEARADEWTLAMGARPA